MIATKQLISELIEERARYAKAYGIDASRVVYNPLLKLHINGIKNNIHTLCI